MLFNLIVKLFGAELVTSSEGANKDSLVSTILADATILLVEDNEINRQVAREILTKAGIRVHEALNGQDALDFLDRTSVDLVLMDIQMPIMDGHGAATRIRAQAKFRELPIIAMTAHAMLEDIEKSQKSGMNDHISKPFDPEELIKIIAKWIKPRPTNESHEPVPAETEPSDSLIPETLPGIDVQLGLKRVLGNEKLYTNLLLLMDEKYANAADEISQSITDNLNDKAVGIAHSVKGTSGMLGADKLFEIAGELENSMASDAGLMDENILKQFRYELDVVIQGIASLKNISPDKTSLNQHAQVSDLKELQAVLHKLRPHLIKGAPVKCREATQKIKLLGWPRELQPLISRLLQSVEEYDFKKALAKLEQVEKNLKDLK